MDPHSAAATPEQYTDRGENAMFDREPEAQPQTAERYNHARAAMCRRHQLIKAWLDMRGTPPDYDGWRGQRGCEGWGYDDVSAASSAKEETSRARADRSQRVAVTLETFKPGALAARHAMVAAEIGADSCNDDFNGRAGSVGYTRRRPTKRRALERGAAPI